MRQVFFEATYSRVSHSLQCISKVKIKSTVISSWCPRLQTLLNMDTDKFTHKSQFVTVHILLIGCMEGWMDMTVGLTFR